MKKLIQIIATFAVLTCFTGCTQNGGHIGKIFGRWHLERIEAENMQAPQPPGDVYWAFQSDVCQMLLDRGEHTFSETYCIYRMEDNTLFLDFTEDRFWHWPLPELGLNKEDELQVLKLTGKEFILLYHPTPETSLTYYLRKW